MNTVLLWFAVLNALATVGPGLLLAIVMTPESPDLINPAATKCGMGAALGFFFGTYALGWTIYSTSASAVFFGAMLDSLPGSSSLPNPECVA